MLDEYVRGQLEHAEQICIHQGILEKKFGIEIPFYKDLIGFMQNVKDYVPVQMAKVGPMRMNQSI